MWTRVPEYKAVYLSGDEIIIFTRALDKGAEVAEYGLFKVDG